MAWTLPRPPEVRFIGFSTGWGSMGEFRIWKKVEVDESYSEAFTLGVPHSAIPGSERAAASVIGASALLLAWGVERQELRPRGRVSAPGLVSRQPVLGICAPGASPDRPLWCFLHAGADPEMTPALSLRSSPSAHPSPV